MIIEQSVLQLILPENVFEWFDLVSGSKDDKVISIVFAEKNNPPLSDYNLSEGQKVVSKGFTDITIADFPIRGKKTLLTFRRRYWQVEGQKKLLKRDIKLCFPGTQLEKEFANFLKADSRGTTSLTGINR